LRSGFLHFEKDALQVRQLFLHHPPHDAIVDPVGALLGIDRRLKFGR
jgi:hypothetical protein